MNKKFYVKTMRNAEATNVVIGRDSAQLSEPCDEYVSKQKVVDLADELMHYCSPMEERTISTMSTHDIYDEFMKRSIAVGKLLNDVCMLPTVEMSSCSDVDPYRAESEVEA